MLFWIIYSFDLLVLDGNVLAELFKVLLFENNSFMKNSEIRNEILFDQVDKSDLFIIYNGFVGRDGVTTVLKHVNHLGPDNPNHKNVHNNRNSSTR